MSDIDPVVQDGVVVLNLKGRVDATNSNEVHEKISDEIKNGCDRMVVNFSDVNYISSAGLRVLIFATKSFSKNQGSFAICSLNDNIRKIFEISGLLSIFNIHEKTEDAVANLRTSSP